MLEFGLTSFGDVTFNAAGGLDSHAQVLRNVVEEAVLAEDVGIDFFGAGEHHRAEFALSAPEVLLGVIAGRTRRIRLGSAVTVLSTDDPVRVFQRFSTLHAASQGRAEVILGRGAFTESFPLFGYDLGQYEPLFDEKLELFAALLNGGAVTWRGSLRTALNGQEVFPTLGQRRLRTWLAVGSTPQSVLRAVRYDLPLMLGIVGGEARRFLPFVEIYRQAYTQTGRPALQIGVHSTGHVADSDARAREEFWSAYKPLRDRLGAERGWPAFTAAKFDAEVERGSLYVGAPKTVADRIVVTMRELGVSRFDLKYSTGTLSHQALLRSIELFGREVVPLVRAQMG
jgi:probable LLM family oxidoreductase